MSKTKNNPDFEAEYTKIFSSRLEEMRQEAGVSARDMSLSLGQNPGYINNIENMKSLPSIPMLFLICEYFGVSPSYFLNVFDENPHSMKVREMMNKIERLSPQQFDALYTLVSDLARKRT